MIMLQFLDLFAGIGGMRRGLEDTGMRCVGYVERDKFARRSYQAIFETEGEWWHDDIQTVEPDAIPKADLWTFGFPCQDLSMAGNRQGFDGARSSLFFTVLGLIQALPEATRPEWLFAENVVGFLSSNQGYDFLAAQAALAESGYDCEWDMLGPVPFGIPQHRNRVFLVGHARNRSRRTLFPLFQEEIDAPEPSPAAVFSTINEVTCNGGGDFVMPSVASPSFIHKHQQSQFREPNRQMYALSAMEPHGAMIRKVAHLANDRGQTGRIFDPNGLAPAILSHHGRSVPKILIGGRIRRLTPRECWRLMGRTNDEFDRAKGAGVSETQLYKQAGNSVIPQIVAAIGRRIAIQTEHPHLRPRSDPLHRRWP